MLFEDDALKKNQQQQGTRVAGGSLTPPTSRLNRGLYWCQVRTLCCIAEQKQGPSKKQGNVFDLRTIALHNRKVSALNSR
jgi:hypothetical protein